MQVERWVYRLPLLLRSLLRRRDVERELEEELHDHVERQTNDLIAQGLTAADARRVALARLGGIERRKDECRDVRATVMVDHLAQDLRYAFRTLRRNAVFTVVTVASLGLGIGAATSVFGVVDALVLRQLPVADPERIVTLREIFPPERTNDEVTYELYTRLRDEADVFDGLAAMNVFDRSNIALSGPDGGIDAGRARVALATGNYFATLGVEAARGRTFGSDDDKTLGAHPVAVVSDAYAVRRLGRTRDLVGRTLTVNRTPFTIIGVMPPGFVGHWTERPTDIWIPFSMHQQVLVEVPAPLVRRNDAWLHLVGRLRADVGRARTEGSVQAVYQRIMHDWAGADASADDRRRIASQRLTVLSAQHGYAPRRDAAGTPLRILGMVTVVVLLVACANVAGMLLARAAARDPEMALRLAIGAGRGRVAQQLVTESVVLAALGALVGLTVAIWGTELLAAGMSAGPIEMFWGRSSWIAFDAHLRTNGLLVAVAAGLTTGLLFGLAPAVRVARVRFAEALVGRGTGAVRQRRFSLGKALEVGQIALSLTIVLTAGLLIRTVSNLESRELGFERDRVLLVWTQPSATGASPGELRTLWDRVLDRLATVPGVVGVSASNGAILNGSIPTPGPTGVPVRVEGRPPKPTNRAMWRTFVAPRYFETMGIPLVAGREFTASDADTTRRVVIINETMARYYFGADDPVGQRLAFGSDSIPGTEIIGVVRDIVDGTPRQTGPMPMRTYYSYRDRESARRIAVMMVAVRTSGDPRVVAGPVREALRSAAPTLPVLDIQTVTDRLADVLAQDRLIAWLATFFALLAGLLACLGLYGLIAYSTTQRTPEIGLRVALGATRRGILVMILREAFAVTLAGIAIGLPLALLAARSLADRLFGVGATDLPTIGIAVSSLLAIAGVAGFIPAHRAAAVDPMIALRHG